MGAGEEGVESFLNVKCCLSLIHATNKFYHDIPVLPSQGMYKNSFIKLSKGCNSKNK